MAIKLYPDQMDMPVHQYITHHTNAEELYNQACVDFIKRHNLSENARGIEFNILDYDHNKLTHDTIEALQTIGYKSWTNSENKQIRYGGLSFVYDPDNNDGTDPEAGTLGSNKNTVNQFFYGRTENTPDLRHSYFDTYAFTEPTTFRNYGYVKEFLDTRCQRTMIRSRLAVIKAGEEREKLNEALWHKDEKIFLNIRINIPITTQENYLFEMEKEEPYHLDIGKAYSWDTYVPHRVLHKGTTTEDRIHFVLGFSPWFDYDKENRCWVQNDFYGKHPFQMMLDGDILTGLSLDRLR